MLNNYKKYLNNDLLKESIIKPDPIGTKEIYTNKSYYKEFNNIFNNLLLKIKEDSSIIMVNILKSEILGKIILIHDSANRQKILTVTDVIVGKKDSEYYPVIMDNDENNKSVRYCWEDNIKSNIFDIGRFLDFFEKNYLNEIISFSGKSINGGNKTKYIKNVTRIGILKSKIQDYLVVECDDKNNLILLHNEPIKIMDKRIKEIDPYAEENWDQ